ncbi:MAG TPA: DUF1631 domain-containing protein [Pseudomonas xinjiangensis]|uniref:DUF1631 domain-containing protein n=2 Tax=root TaxID=1 RepID=A0A7V1FRR7_9GAMM|nr:DUF1631 domain-containing protein [Halopseudomonas xinjiangensis]HEC46571.1 DUF1631 domain-containing protein [Halopseudomonas xinjiangensis]
MAQDHKIIPINAGDIRRQAPGSAQPALPQPLRAVSNHALGFLKIALGDLFDNADDSLFEMADRAASNNDQTLFFEAMRVVRLQRHAIEKACAVGLVKALEALNQSEIPASQDLGQSFQVDSLSLVQPDELEQSVALDGMVGRVVSRNRPALAHLAIRLNSLVKGLVDERNNPFGPASLAQIFVDSYAELELDIKVRLIILKLFERYVFNRVDSLYEEANNLFVAAGVMPDLTFSAVNGKRGMRSPSAMATQTIARGESPDRTDHQHVLSMFSDLIGSWRHASGDTALTSLGSSGATPMASDELLGMLAQMPLDEPGAGGSSINLVRNRIHQRLGEQRRQTGQARSVARVDDDVISLVSMLFDFILDDNNLPAALKALVARLQLPVLRVAIADKSFFSLSSHPARRLLNELARATLGWSDHDDLGRDQLHLLLESIVTRLLSEADPAAELFGHLHAELAEFVKVEQRRSSRFEQRTRDAEEGRAKVDAARNRVAVRLNALLVGKTLPVLVVDIVRDTWSQVMQMIWLREGEESSAWQEAIHTAESLIDSVDSASVLDTADRQRGSEKVREAVRGSLDLIGYDEQQSVVLMERLAELQHTILTATSTLRAELATIEADDAVYEPQPSRYEATVQKERATELIGLDELALDDSASNTEPDEPLFEAVHVVEPVLQAGSGSIEAELVSDLPSVDAASWVDNLHTGGWFELTAAEGQPVQRCKLAAIISFSGKYIFVNRSGMKVAEYGKSALYHHFDQGLIRLVDDNQLFDRALESVIGNLRRLQSATS